MLSLLQEIDQEMFLGINRGLANPFFDTVMPYLRNRYFWMPLYLFLVVFLIGNYRKAGVGMIIAMFLTFGIADYSASSIIKPAFERLRPCNDPQLQPLMISRIACGTGYSMPSSHASNHFGIAVFLITLFYRRWRWILPLGLLWALSICFAQIYVGVHYPFDTMIGGILGSIIGYLVATVFLAIQTKQEWNTGD
ncbi:MAG TPA: phosphatase PAP2 family protein [Sphingobacteriaceae bacterium]